MHAHAKTFMFAGATCLAVYGAAFAYTPVEMADVYVLQNESAGTYGQREQQQPDDAFIAAQRIRIADASWPVEKRGVITPFGPRRVFDEVLGTDVVTQYAGIDLQAANDGAVLAAADGEVYAVYGPQDAGNPHPNAGTVVVLRHVAEKDLQTNGRPTRRYYTLYAGLDAAFVRSPAQDEIIKITKGSRIATAYGVEMPLYFEVRARAVDGPTLNPLALLPYDDRDSLTAEIVSTSPPAVRISTDEDESDIAEVFLQTNGIVRRYALGELPQEVQITMDAPAKNGRHEFTLVFTDATNAQSVVVRDVWGKGVRLTP